MMKLFPFIIHHSAFIVSLLLFSFRQPAPVGRSPNAAHVDRSAAYALDDDAVARFEFPFTFGRISRPRRAVNFHRAFVQRPTTRRDDRANLAGQSFHAAFQSAFQFPAREVFRENGARGDGECNRDDEEGEKLKWVAEACEAGERGDERADAEPQHNEAGREDFCHEQTHAEHNPDDPDVVFHQPLSAPAMRAAIWAEQRARLSPQPLSMFFSTNQTLAGRSARRRMKYGYQVLP